MSGVEIRDLKRAGVQVTDTVEVPEVAFTVGIKVQGLGFRV